MPQRAATKDQEPKDGELLPGFGTRVRHKRQELKLGMNELDKRASIASGLTSRIESGKRVRVSAEVVLRLARALNSTPNYLLTGADVGNQLRRRSGWLKALSVAFSTWGTQVPEWAWEAAGDMILPGDVKLTPRLIYDCAHLLAQHTPEREHSSVRLKPGKLA